MTLPSATQFPAISFKYGVTDAVYRDPFALLDEITAIMTADLKTLASSGISYLQIDAPRYSYFLDPKWRAWMENELRVDPECDAHRFATRRQCLLCRGSHSRASRSRSTCAAATTAATGTPRAGTTRSPNGSFMSWRSIAFLLEYDDERSGRLRAAAVCSQEQNSRVWGW